MKKRDIEKRLKQAFSNTTPDVLDDILSECENQKGRIIVMTDLKIKNRFAKWAACAAAVCVLLAGGLFGMHIYQTDYKVDSVVSLDVNPSIEIQTNQKEQVLAVKALNEDGKIVIGDMNFKGSNLEVTVNALIGSMLRNGYLSEVANSILISIDGNDTERTAALQEKLADEINNLLRTDTFSGAVLCQTVLPDDDLKATAEAYGISKGKAQLISQIVAQNPLYSFEELAALTINELNLLSESGDIKLENISSIGSASEKAYIGIESAKDIAYSDAGITADSIVTKVEIELDYKHSAMVYKIEFACAGTEYEYEINAITGEILDVEKQVKENDPTAGVVISTETAKAIAFEHAGITADDAVIALEIQLENKNSAMVYKIEFKCGKTEYEYQVSAITGEIINFKKDADDSEEYENNSSDTNDVIDKEAAKAIAFNHAGVSADKDVSKLEIKRSYENGIEIYEIEFVFKGYEYEYDVNAATGEIINCEKEATNDDSEQYENNSSDTNDVIGKEAAKAIAFNHAGVSADKDVSKLEIKRSYENGIEIYEIEFVFNGYEYEYDVNAATGEIIQSNK